MPATVHLSRKKRRNFENSVTCHTVRGIAAVGYDPTPWGIAVGSRDIYPELRHWHLWSRGTVCPPDFFAMADTKESDLKTIDLVEQVDSVKEDVDVLRSLRGVAALEVAGRLEPPKKTSKRMLQLYCICGFMFLGSTMNGYDGSLFGNILALARFQEHFGAAIVGVKTGIISSMLQIGSVCALPFVGPAADLFGRRVGIAIGCAFIVMGTILQGTAPHLDQYMAGRFFVGFGGTIANAICPSFVVEFAHPTMRGVITGLYNTCYYLGSITAAAVLRGCAEFDSNNSWLIPTWIQMLFPGILLLGCMALPESPRWLYSHGHFEQSRACITKYHGNDNPDSLWVKLQMREFEEELELDGADKRWWDYRALFNSRASLYRVLLCAVAISMFSQWTGQVGSCMNK
jgi:MFS family permease